ncbi:MAG: ABC transporter substrate-binding protein [Rhodospirillales bacterium]|nr:ABC transporter substrate-binding protein [Alphaproteobacteria bacterium]MBL6947107.1 ABC transporter substrate-binding protein [Rhodospirillales bacterium]
MKFRSLLLGALGAVVCVTGVAVSKAAYSAEQFIPMLVYRTGPYAPSGIPVANGFRDYYTLVNKRDGGINGVKIVFEECETKYNTKQGVECYEKLKNKGPTGASLVNPYSTGITYQLIPKSAVDGVPILSMGYGRTSAADGRVFKWVFNFPATYWSQASAFVKYVGRQEGGMANLKGKKIVHLYHNSAYGKEANPTLETLAKKYGFKLTLIAVDHPGQEQKAQWLQIRRKKPHWIFMSGWGVMNQVAIKEAAGINYPMDHFVGNWWSGSDADVVPAGAGSKGYKSATFHGAGAGWGVHEDIVKHIYGGDAAKAQENKMGEVLYNRGMVNAMFGVEAIRTAMKKYGNKSMTGAQVRWGLENLNVNEARLSELGMKGFTQPVKVSCSDHETSGPVMFQQWDGSKWSFASIWVPPMRDVVRPMIEKDAANYAKENKITPRKC